MQDNGIGDYTPKAIWHPHKSKDSVTQRTQITHTSVELVFRVIMWKEFQQLSDWGRIIHFIFKTTHTHTHMYRTSHATLLNAEANVTQPAAVADSEAKSHNPFIYPTYRIPFKGETLQLSVSGIATAVGSVKNFLHVQHRRNRRPRIWQSRRTYDYLCLLGCDVASLGD
jgi:hypothetical protein